MKIKLIAIIFILFFKHSSFGQATISKTIVKSDTNSVKETSMTLTQPFPRDGKDSIVISIQQFDELKKLFKKEEDIMSDILPSLIALIVVLISTGGAIYIGKRQINIQIKNGEEQLRSQEAQSQEQLKVSREQIQETTNTTLKQINSVNRQAWVIETRNTIAEMTGQANLLNIEFQEKKLNREKIKIVHEKFTYNKNKLSLLLKPEKEKHKLLIDSMIELMTTLDSHLLNSNANNNPDLNIGYIPYDNGKFIAQTNKVIEYGRNLLYDEWAKIQS